MTRLTLPDQDTEQCSRCRHYILDEESGSDRCFYTESYCIGNLGCRPKDCPLVEVKDDKEKI